MAIFKPRQVILRSQNGFTNSEGSRILSNRFKPVPVKNGALPPILALYAQIKLDHCAPLRTSRHLTPEDVVGRPRRNRRTPRRRVFHHSGVAGRSCSCARTTGPLAEWACRAHLRQAVVAGLAELATPATSSAGTTGTGRRNCLASRQPIRRETLQGARDRRAGLAEKPDPISEGGVLICLVRRASGRGLDPLASSGVGLGPRLQVTSAEDEEIETLPNTWPLKMRSDVQDSIEVLGQGDHDAYYVYLLHIRKGAAHMTMGLPAWDSEGHVASGALAVGGSSVPSADPSVEKAAHDVGAAGGDVGAAATPSPSLNPQAAAFVPESHNKVL
ncbi:hypothetical protein F4779DRAFT_637014 [Xylariaceae sp. FL0662B]|nr:hypothetical protein F4779DRAFT_637014 [Xylariaceae sp. FL0662B]